MAWEEESIESGVDFEESGGKKSPIKLILMVVIVLAVLGGAYFAYTKFLAGDDEPTPEGEGGEEAAAAVEQEQAPPPAAGFKVDLDKFTLNLSGGAAPHYLVCTISLEVTTQELKDLLSDQEDSQLYMVKTRDAILQVLRAKTFEEVKDPAAIREIGNEIKFKLSRIYAEGDVMNVYFSEFLID